MLAKVDHGLSEETDTYQTHRVNVKHVNANQNMMTYSHELINIIIEAPLALIVPSSRALIGGSTGFYVRSLGVSGKATIKIESVNSGTKTIDIEVKSQ